MRSFSVLPIAAAFSSLVLAQTIDPDSVSLSTRDTWCTDQMSQCPLICGQVTASLTTEANDCDPTTLVWDCICSNGQTPPVANFSLTIPFHECQEYQNQCVANCGMNENICANNCRTQTTCGAQDPTRVNATTTSSSTIAAATSSSSGFSSFGGSGSGAGSGSGSGAGNSGSSLKGTAAALEIGKTYSLAALALGIFGGFAILL